MLRRQMLALAVPATIVACTTPSGATVTPLDVVNTALNVANALAQALPQIAALPVVLRDAKASAAIAKAQAGVASAQAVLNTLAANLPPATKGAAVLSTVWGYLNAALLAAEAVPGLSDNVRTYLASAGIGLPIVELFINQTLGTSLKS